MNNQNQKPISYQNQEQDRRIEVLEKHFEKINSEMGEIKTDLAQVKQDVCWIKKFFFIIATASISSLVVALFNLLEK